MSFANILEKKWLTEHGGRNEADLMVDKHGKKFVLMRDHGKDREVYLPDFDKLHDHYVKTPKSTTEEPE